MANGSRKLTQVCPWGSSSLLAAKHHRLDSGIGDGNGPPLSTEDAAFDGCLRLSPTPNLDTMGAQFLRKLSAELEPPPSLLELYHPFVLLAGRSPSGPGLPTVQLTPTNYMSGPVNADIDHSFSPCPLPDVVSPPTGMQASLAALEADLHVARLAHAKQEQSDKSTLGTYKRHVNRYEKWWMRYQAEQSTSIDGWTAIPAFPITAAKVSMFLGHKSTQAKVRIPLTDLNSCP
jgi:hypothetical protein